MNIAHFRSFVLLVSSFIILSCQDSSILTQSPNIVFIIVDDVSWSDIGPKGNQKIKQSTIEMF